MKRYAIVIEKATGNYAAYLPALPGCVATGATAAVALAGLRAAGAGRTVLAVPVIQADVAARFRDSGTEVIALEEPRLLGSVGAFYADFHQLSDEEVLALMGGPDA